jgi:hypothetical protein
MLADIIVVDGDPVKDIRVLQERERIVTVMKDGRVIRFGDEESLRLHPYEAAQTFTTKLLMYDTVYGDPDGDRALEPLPTDDDEGRSLAGDLKKRERDGAVSLEGDRLADELAKRTTARPN